MLSYPKTEHLKQVIALGVQQQAFESGLDKIGRVEIGIVKIGLYYDAHQFIQVHRRPPPQKFACSEERRGMNLALFSKQLDVKSFR